MNDMTPTGIVANGREYARPDVPAIAICLDGCEPEYFDAAIAAGLMPALERIMAKGTARRAYGVIPSFTNPNNLSIAPGVRRRCTESAATIFTIRRRAGK